MFYINHVIYWGNYNFIKKTCYKKNPSKGLFCEKVKNPQSAHLWWSILSPLAHFIMITTDFHCLHLSYL